MFDHQAEKEEQQSKELAIASKVETTTEFSAPEQPWGGEGVVAAAAEPAVHSWADEAAAAAPIPAGVPPPAAVPTAAAPLPAYNTTEDWATQVTC